MIVGGVVDVVVSEIVDEIVCGVIGVIVEVVTVAVAIVVCVVSVVEHAEVVVGIGVCVHVVGVGSEPGGPTQNASAPVPHQYPACCSAAVVIVVVSAFVEVVGGVGARVEVAVGVGVGVRAHAVGGGSEPGGPTQNASAPAPHQYPSCCSSAVAVAFAFALAFSRLALRFSIHSSDRNFGPFLIAAHALLSSARLTSSAKVSACGASSRRLYKIPLSNWTLIACFTRRWTCLPSASFTSFILRMWPSHWNFLPRIACFRL